MFVVDMLMLCIHVQHEWCILQHLSFRYKLLHLLDI